MRSINKYIQFTSLLFVFVTSVGANAGIISATGFGGGNGSISVDCTIGGFDCDITKQYSQVGEMTINFEVDSGGNYTLNETISNLTAEDWTDYHWRLGEEFGDVTFVSFSSIDPFTNLSGTSDSVDVDGGVVPIGAGFFPNLVINVGNAQGGLFVLTQVPTTNGVPEPSALFLTALGLVGIGLSRRRRPVK